MQMQPIARISAAGGQLRRRALGPLVLSAALCAWLGPAAGAAIPDQTPKPAASSSHTSATTHRPAHAHKPSAAKPAPAVPAPQVAAAPAAPPAPNWPVNDKPSEATVVWDSHGLRIDAANSSLVQILKDVATDTGAKVEGLGADTRVFGTYGPGPANEVLSQLLNDTSYNVLMIGDQGAGAPRRIVLSSQPTGPAAPQSTASNTGDEDSEPEQPQPLDPPNIRNGFAPPQPRTQQQIEEMQLRQEQVQQQLRQQMLNQQQPQQPPETNAPQ